MSQRSIGDLPSPPEPYRVDLLSREPNADIGFESASAAMLEDTKRVALLRASAKTLSPGKRLKALRLAAKLEHAAAPRADIYESPASARFRRDFRNKATGALLPLVAKAGGKRVKSFCLIPDGPKWLIPAEKLGKVIPAALLRSIRADLYRHDAREASGWIYIALDAEFEPISSQWQLHVHGLAAKGMIEVLGRLRHTRKYRGGEVRRRVQLQSNLTNLPKIITYTHKAFWGSRAVVEGVDGARIRQARRSRIPKPHHTQYLLWLDRQCMRDLTLLVRLRVTSKGLSYARARNKNKRTRYRMPKSE